MKLSVVIISYNQGKYIRQALDGVVKQKTTFPFEVIIADDCSSDDTLKICQEFEKEYPFVKIKQICHNIGYSANWERALHLGSGEYVAIFEADDYWTDSCKLQIQAENLDAHPDVGLCYTDCDILYEGSRKLCKSIISNKTCIINAKNPMETSGPYLCNVTWLVRQSFLEQIEAIPDCLDYPLFIFYEACFKSKLSYLNKSTSVFRKHNGSLSNSGIDKKQYSWLRSSFLIKEHFTRIYYPSKLAKVYTRGVIGLYNNAKLYNDNALIKVFIDYYQNTDIIEEIIALQNETNIAYNSKSFKLGHFILSPLRLIRNICVQKIRINLNK